MKETKDQYEARMAAAIAARDGTADSGAQVSNGNAAKPNACKSADRWATLNTFVDVIAPRLTLAERAVWLVMFRYARNGVVETSERHLATAANIDKVTAGRALRRLTSLRLVWPIFKSRSKATQSKYGLHPKPATCLARAIETEPRGVRGREEPGEQITRIKAGTG